jgi:hypothetical protein
MGFAVRVAVGPLLVTASSRTRVRQRLVLSTRSQAGPWLSQCSPAYALPLTVRLTASGQTMIAGLLHLVRVVVKISALPERSGISLARMDQGNSSYELGDSAHCSRSLPVLVALVSPAGPLLAVGGQTSWRQTCSSSQP